MSIPVAISGTRRAMKELVDGTIRVQIDIDPPFRAAFLSMFPDIDMPIALAPLQIGLPPPKPPRDVVTGPLSSTPPLPKREADPPQRADDPGAIQDREHEKRKSKFPTGLCGLAVKWCSDPHFHNWLDYEFIEEMAAAGIDAKTPEDQAAAVIKRVCKIDTRKELDTIHSAGAMFREHIMGPYIQARKDDHIDDE